MVNRTYQPALSRGYRSLVMTGMVCMRPSPGMVWVDPPLLCLDEWEEESTPRLLTLVLIWWARLRKTFLRTTPVTLLPLLVGFLTPPCSSPCLRDMYYALGIWSTCVSTFDTQAIQRPAYTVLLSF